jgi:hypothetical protein
MRAAAAFALLLSSVAAPTLAADLGSCVALGDDAARLACYDRVAGRPSPSPATITVAPTPGAAPAATVAAPVAKSFGAEQLPSTQTAKAAEPSAMQAHIVGTFEGWDTKTRFTLDNGQVWQVTDDRSAYYPATSNPAVTIEKGAFGSYYLSLDGLNTKAKIKRVK